MNKSLAIAALVAATLGLGAAAPSFAQDATTTPARQWQDSGPQGATPDRNMGPGRYGRGSEPGRYGRGMAPGRGMGMGMGMGMGPGGLLMLACSDRGAEALEIALVRMSHRLDLTADQQKLFDTFRTNALTAETKFTDACKAERPTATNGARPDLLDRLKAGLTLDQARLTALNGVLPDFEALYNSLSDTQKAALVPHQRHIGPGGMGNGRWGGPGGNRGAAPRAPQPDAPTSAPTTL
jgi:hypothetical protein